MTDEERTARRRKRRRSNLILPLVCLVCGGLAFWYAFSGGLEELLRGYGIDLLHQPIDEEPVVELQPRDTLGEYSWEDLSEISARIAEAGEGWRDVAYGFGLIAEDGTLTGGTKQVSLADGTTFDVHIVGFNHDWHTDGSGPVGLTFMSTSCVALRAMNSSNLAAGGWESCELRGWLDNEMAALLPDDLAAVIQSVLKPSNNVGRIDAYYQAVPEELVWNTQDALWVPSAVEVCGPVNWYVAEYGDRYQRVDDVINAEGGQYQRFAEAGVTGTGDPSGVLTRRWADQDSSWWYRTPYCFLSDQYYGVMPDGFPHTWTDAAGWQGVVVGFCV